MRSTIIMLSFALLSSNAMAAQTAVATGTADATVVSNLGVNQTAGLDFGTITSGSTAGAVTVTATGATSTGGATVTGGTPVAGQFAVTGDVNGIYGVSIPSAATLTKTGGGANMGVNLTLIGANATGNALSNTGSGSFGVGGTLTIGQNQAPGTYHGTYPVTVSY